jgi:ABC-type sugar transport system substrate-binding protein
VTSGPDGSRGALRQALEGDSVDRRAVLRLAAGAALGLWAPAAIPACGTVGPPVPQDESYAINAVSAGPPVSDLARMIEARAVALGLTVTLSSPTGASDLAIATARNSQEPFNFVTDKDAYVNSVVVVGNGNPRELEPLAAKAIRNGIMIVSYPTAMLSRSAAIVVDVVQGAALLAAHAAAWSREHPRSGRQVLLVLPGADASGNPYLPQSASIEQAFRSALASSAPHLEGAVTTQAFGSADMAVVASALSSHPEIRMVLVWDDDTAIGAAAALRRRHGRASRRDLYVGGVGAPTVTSRATFDELQRNDVLRVVVAARALDLANAMVDLPHALLNGGHASDIRVAPRILTPNSRELRSYSQDYALDPSPPLGGYREVLNPA